MKDRQKTVERLKTALIVLLVAGAFYLLYMTHIIDYFAPGIDGISLLSIDSGTSGDDTGTSDESGRPACIIIKNDNGRYGAQYSTDAVGELYNKTGNFLREAFGSASEPEQADQSDWEAALAENGVYYEFLGAAPMELFAGWLGTEIKQSDMDVLARRFVLAHGADDVMYLYYINEEDESYFRCQTAVDYADLADSTSGYSPNGTGFAFEMGDAYKNVCRYCVISGQLPQVAQISAANIPQDEDFVTDLMRKFNFNIYTNSRYTETGGTEVIVASGATLRIGSGGEVSYKSDASSGQANMVIDEDGDEPSRMEILDVVGQLVRGAVGAFSGEAEVVLSGFEYDQSEESYIITYKYVVNGIPVFIRGQGCAASVTVKGNAIVDLEMYYRNYSVMEAQALVLPELQAAAAMDKVADSGSELGLSYVDSGNEAVSAAWLAR